MKSWLPILALFFVFVALNIQSTEADGYGHGHSHSAKGTACIVKGSYCNCHYCKCEKGHVHCGGYGKGGHGKIQLFFLFSFSRHFNRLKIISFKYQLRIGVK